MSFFLLRKNSDILVDKRQDSVTTLSAHIASHVEVVGVRLVVTAIISILG